MVLITPLEKEDYYQGFLELLEQLTTTNSKNMNLRFAEMNVEKPHTHINYDDFVKQLKMMYNSYVFVVWSENKIVGTGTLLLERKFIHNLGFVGHIEDIVIDKNHRRKGFGKLLIDHLISVSESLKCYKVILDCSLENIPFYEKCGFKCKETQMVKYF